MQITLTSKEFDEAVSLWLEAQGFTPDDYHISTRIIAGRSDGGAGTRMTIDLEKKPSTSELLAESARIASLTDMDIQITTGGTSSTRRFGQGHTNE